VLLSGAGLGVLGVIALATLPWPATWRALAAMLWSSCVAWELVCLRSAWRDSLGLQLRADGSAAALGRDGRWRPVTLLADSVLLRRWGWIRLRAPSGRIYAEPVRGQCRKSRDWRRLQVIWRHIGAAG
jgi:hypothetical protein